MKYELIAEFLRSDCAKRSCCVSTFGDFGVGPLRGSTLAVCVLVLRFKLC